MMFSTSLGASGEGGRLNIVQSRVVVIFKLFFGFISFFFDVLKCVVKKGDIYAPFKCYILVNFSFSGKKSRNRYSKQPRWCCGHDRISGRLLEAQLKQMVCEGGRIVC